MKPVVVLVAAAVAVSGMGMGSSAFAGEDRVVVTYGELDLSKPAGREVMMSRLQMAAKQVCIHEPHPVTLNYRQAQAHAACVREKVSSAVASLPPRVAMELREGGLREATLQ